MTGGLELPEAIAREIDAVSEATAELLEAARAADPRRMRHAVRARGEAITRLEAPLRDWSERLDPEARRQLEDVRQALASGAGQALGELRELTDRIRVAFVSLGRDARAIRSYTATRSDPVVLDRST